MASAIPFLMPAQPSLGGPGAIAATAVGWLAETRRKALLRASAARSARSNFSMAFVNHYKPDSQDKTLLSFVAQKHRVLVGRFVSGITIAQFGELLQLLRIGDLFANHPAAHRAASFLGKE